MTSDWQRDKIETDAFMPHVKSLCGQYLIGDATEEEDCHEATDLRVLGLRSLRIGVRLRRFSLLTKHPEWANQFTVRYSRPSGMETEFAKIMGGWCDYLFYGWMEGNSTRPIVVHWTLGDLSIFRAWVYEYRNKHGGAIPGVRMQNRDKSSDFMAFWLTESPIGKIMTPTAFTVAHENYAGLPQRHGNTISKPSRFTPTKDGQMRMWM